MVLTRLQQKQLEEESKRENLIEINPVSEQDIGRAIDVRTNENLSAQQSLSSGMAQKSLTMHISKQLDQLPLFSGKLNENVIKWLNGITNELNVMKYDDDQKLSVIQTYLMDDARKWFINNSARLGTWPSFCEAIVKTFSSSFAKEVAINQVSQRRQGLNETVMHYYSEMMELFYIMDHQMSDSLKVSYLKTGLKLSLKKEVSRKNRDTPAEFLKIAQEEESLDYAIDTEAQNLQLSSINEKQITNNLTIMRSPSPLQNCHCALYTKARFQNDTANNYTKTPITHQEYQIQHYPDQQQHQNY
ncbi:unnamed protein product [Rotaria sp. Silwood2]|nr:unnamed protein product [Rotaria sp. Silwood2]CAF3090587.1 unnamed protein product [Rotaria sp. Silwood2]CAF3400076.1 unnamed protein product [Rotaria sp. Silwood2]CAF3414457.1 unnamed protein product [Rotaria sp. Silwood2]CAF4168865.1 unnamed protein product [Rotaria sp. Silwood2]